MNTIPTIQADRNSLKAIFESHFHPLCGFGNKFIADKQVVEDLVQDAFIAYWEKRDTVKDPSAIKAYLYTAVRNSCLNYLKHLKVKQKHENNLIRELESEQFFTNYVIEEEVFNILYTEIKQLPPSAQQIMLLALNGLKNNEIADELGISVNTVKSQKKDAYAKLKHKIGPVLQGILLSL